MKRGFLTSICLALSVLIAACGSRPDIGKAEGPHPALWEIVNGSGSVEGWMFGTIHALPDGTKGARHERRGRHWHTRSLSLSLREVPVALFATGMGGTQGHKAVITGR